MTPEQLKELANADWISELAKEICKDYFYWMKKDAGNFFKCLEERGYLDANFPLNPSLEKWSINELAAISQKISDICGKKRWYTIFSIRTERGFAYMEFHLYPKKSQKNS